MKPKNKNKKSKIIGNTDGIVGIMAILLMLGGLLLFAIFGGLFDNEEDGTQYGLDETCDKVFDNGVHLIMSYDAQSNAFIGSV